MLLPLLARVSVAANGTPLTLSLSDLLAMPGLDVEEDEPYGSSIPGGDKIPDDNDLYLCTTGQDDDVCQLEQVDLVPDPPQRCVETHLHSRVSIPPPHPA